MKKNLFVVMHYDYEDPDWSEVEFLGLSEEECLEYINKYFEDYLRYDWDEEEVFDAKSLGENWIKEELRLEIKELDPTKISQSLKDLLK